MAILLNEKMRYGEGELGNCLTRIGPNKICLEANDRRCFFVGENKNLKLILHAQLDGSETTA